MKDLLKWVAYGAVFAVPFVLLIVSSTMFFPYITGKNFAFRILVEIGFAAWLLLAIIDQAYRPRLSYILYAVLGLLGVMFLANLLGEYAPKSFWSNYERMEGWVTLFHFFLYFVTLGSLLTTEKLWNYFFNTALVAGGLMSCFALGQVFGVTDVSQGTAWRVDGRLGNSTYLGVYMLFHVFIAAWLMLRSKTLGLRLMYGGLIIVFIFIMTQTGTRGTVYGLIGGSILGFLYLALMAPKRAMIKKWALGGLVAVVLAVGCIWLLRDTAFVQNSPALDRFAGTTWAEGNIRFLVWNMALEGVKEHPILGWGQENFSYVFNKYYDPALYGAEPWYDRTHNIFLDWLIAGGVLGLVAYLSILAAALWYVVLAPFMRRFLPRLSLRLPSLFIEDQAENEKAPVQTHKAKEAKNSGFTVYEQALIFGLLAAYMFHNLFVFDNLGSWIFYAVVLALIHSRISSEWQWASEVKVSTDTWQKVAVPTVAVLAIITVYFANIPSMQAAGNIIDAYRATTVADKMAAFETAFGQGGFATQEIFEQLLQHGSQTYQNPNLTEEEKALIRNRVESAIVMMKEEKPGDARVHIISASYFRAVSDLNRAMAELDAALKLSPKKQAIFEEQGLIYILAGRHEEALERYRAAYALDERNLPSRVRAAAAALYFDDEASFRELLPPEEMEKRGELWRAFVNEQMMLQLAYEKKRYDVVEEVMRGKVELNPDEKSFRVNLAALFFEQKDFASARAVIEEAMRDIPSFRSEGESILAELDAAS